MHHDGVYGRCYKSPATAQFAECKRLDINIQCDQKTVELVSGPHGRTLKNKPKGCNKPFLFGARRIVADLLSRWWRCQTVPVTGRS